MDIPKAKAASDSERKRECIAQIADSLDRKNGFASIVCDAMGRRSKLPRLA